MRNRTLPIRMLPDPWVPLDTLLEANSFASVAQFATGTIVGANNTALYGQVIFPCDATIYALRMMAGNGTGNYDIGLYNSAFARQFSSGSVAMTAAGLKTLAVSDYRVLGGQVYYIGIALSNSTGQVIRAASSAVAMQAAGVGQEASAFPLPATATPVTMLATAFPLFAFGVR